MVGLQVVQLIKALQADAILLGDRVHGLARLNIMQTPLIILRRFLLLLFQPDNLTLFKLVLPVSLVVSGYLTIADAYFLTYSLKSVTTTSYKIVVLVEDTNDMQTSTINLLILGALRHKLIVALGIIVLVELVKLDYLYQFIGILRIGSITCGFQTSRPPFIIGDAQLEQLTIAATACKETGMILIRLIS